jgi:hypothetical protein
MTTTEPTTLRFHTEVDRDEDYYRPLRDWTYACAWVGEHGGDEPPCPEPEDLPFDTATCAMCGGDVGAGLYSREDTYGRETEYEGWVTTFRGPLGVVCEDCVQPAEEAVARLLRSDWFAPVRDILRYVIPTHATVVPDVYATARAWVAANLPE